MESESPKKTVKTKKFKLDENYTNSSLDLIKEMLKGNQIDAEKIVIESCEGEVIHFIAETRINVTTKISKKTTPGRVKGPVQIASETECQEHISKEYLALFEDDNLQKQICDIILKREDKGFAQKNLFFPIPLWKKDYVLFEPCGTCRSTGNIQCRHCNGKGIDHCIKCHGTSYIHCTNCNGACMIQGPQGNKIQCPRCHGRGKIGCTVCAQSGKVQCRTCASKGTTKCTNCNGNGWASHLTIVEIEGRCEFNYPDDELPDKVVAMIEQYGDKIKEHADIQLIETEVEVTDESEEDERDAKHKILKIPIFYNVVLPYGHIEYNIKDKSYYAFLFGKTAQASHVSPFMEDVLQNGVRKLGDAAEGRGAAEDNLAQAAKYKTLRQIMILAANKSLGGGIKLFEKTYPYGFKEGSVRDLFATTKKAYQTITKRSMTAGLMAASGLSAVILGAYFALPVRGLIANKIPNVEIMGLVDLCVLALTMLIGNMVIKSFAASALMKVLRRIMPKQKFKSIATTTGKANLIHALLAAILFAVIIEATRHIGLVTPEWYLKIMP